jgi:hypothetical protein
MPNSSKAVLFLLAVAACATKPPATEGFISVPGGKIYWARMGNGPGLRTVRDFLHRVEH